MSAAAVALAVSATGLMRTKTTPLLTIEEADRIAQPESPVPRYVTVVSDIPLSAASIRQGAHLPERVLGGAAVYRLLHACWPEREGLQ